MKKSRIEKLIPIANQIFIRQYGDAKDEYDKSKETNARKRNEILDKAILRADERNQYYIKSNYDGKVSGFGITVSLSGLRPALAMYFNESGDVKTRPILEALAKIIAMDGEYNKEIDGVNLSLKLPEDLSDRTLVDLAINPEMNVYLPVLKKYVLEATTAMKQVIRTYELR